MRTIGYAGIFVAGWLGAAGCFGSTAGTGPDLAPDAGGPGASDSAPPPVGVDDASEDSTVTSDSGDASPQVDAGPGAHDSATPVDAGNDVSIGSDAGEDAGPAADAASDGGEADGGGADGAADATSDAAIDAATGPDAAGDSGCDAASCLPTLTVTGGGNNKITLANGVALYITDAHSTWSFGGVTPVTYENLPPALIGAVGNDTVNNGNLVSFTLSGPTTCYLLRQVNWSGVDLTGWSQLATAAYYFDGYNNGAYGTAIIYSKTLGPGTYDLSTYSATYACAAH